MSGSNFAIVNLRDGARRDIEPFLIENDAFPILENAYLFRGRIQRRSAYSTIGTGYGRLRWSLGNTGASPFTYTLLDIPILVGYAQFSITPAGGPPVFLTDPGTPAGPGVPVALLSTDSNYSGTITRDTGALSIAHPVIAPTAVFYYPGLPVMGLRVREQASINDELLVGFDTKYSYLFDTGSADFIAANTYKTTNAIFTWSGANFDLFWSMNYLGVMWTTNNNFGLNGYVVTGGTNVAPYTFNAPAGHNIVIGDIFQVMTTDPIDTIAGFTFTVTNVVGNTITYVPQVPPANVWTGFISQLNRNTLNIAGAILGDGIKWFDGPGGGTGWANFFPPLSVQSVITTTPRYLRGALMVVAYKDRLLCLNTYESEGVASPVNYRQRVRWSQDGTPFYTVNNSATPSSRTPYLLPTNQTAQQDAWNDVIPGKGGFLDAPTGEAIVGAEFIKDVLIVYFERSTWKLLFTGIKSDPFVFQKINTELGTESTFSTVPFDRGVFGVGNYGIISCDSVNVGRIDDKIPDEVFQIQNLNNGVKRVCGIRDYNSELVYWTYPIVSDEDNDVTTYSLTFPNQVLVYNYHDGSWAEFDDSFTCFGYWQSLTDRTWQSFNNADDTWQNTNITWNSQVLQAKYPNVVGGNQRGFVVVFSQLQNNTQNSRYLEISNITIAGNQESATLLVPDHNLVIGQYILITTANGTTNFNDKIFLIQSVTANILTINCKKDANDNPLLFSGTYVGGGYLTPIPNFNITTKQFNPFYKNGDSCRVNYIDIYLDRTEDGEITAKFFTNSNTSESLPQDDSDLTIPRDPVVLTRPETAPSFSANQTRIWHRIYTNTFGSFFQNVFTLSDAQITDPAISGSAVRIHGLIYYVNAAGRISYDI